MKTTDVIEFRCKDNANEIIKGVNFGIDGQWYVVDVIEHKGGTQNHEGENMMLNSDHYEIIPKCNPSIEFQLR